MLGELVAARIGSAPLGAFSPCPCFPLSHGSPMPNITINGKECTFEDGQTILQAANAADVEIPQYCYHDGLSVVASCRICLAEVWAPNPRNDNKLEPFMGGKLMPTCQTPAGDGMVVYGDSPKAVANQKSVMEMLLINHPLDCPVCDQAGECSLQDYSYEYGRGVSRFQEQKVKQPKKDLGPHVYLYSDRCIMCSRCVRFTQEVSGTGELSIQGRGNGNEIDIFPGKPLDNDLSANVIDLCPVGALLDKDFLFAQRVWFLKSTPSIDPITASGDNVWIDHNEGKIYRLRPRTNMAVNKWWITDEVRYGWKFASSEGRLRSPMHRRFGALAECDYVKAYVDCVEGLKAVKAGGKNIAVLVSPMLTCEEAYSLAQAARAIDSQAILSIGPVPVDGQDKVFPAGMDRADAKAFVKYAEKAPNARGVRRVLEAVADPAHVASVDLLIEQLKDGKIGGVILTGNYPSQWATPRLIEALGDAFVVLVDTLGSDLLDAADVVLPGATWAEKAGTFENANHVLQAFEQAIPPIQMAKSEGQIALDLIAEATGSPDAQPGTRLVVVDEQPGAVPASTEVARPRAGLFNAANVRQEMAAKHEKLGVFVSEVKLPSLEEEAEWDMEMVEL